MIKTSPENNTSGVYRITNLMTGKHYIGSSVNLQRRWRKHRNNLQRRENTCTKLQSAWNEFGADKFEFVQILLCSVNDLLTYEQICIDFFDAVNNGYNICHVAGSSRGRKTAEETKKKLSEASKKAATPEARAKISARNLGRIHGSVARENMSLAARARSSSTSEKMKQVWEKRREMKQAAYG